MRNNAMKNYELLQEQNLLIKDMFKLINDITEKFVDIELNIQYIYKIIKEREKRDELDKSWFFSQFSNNHLEIVSHYNF